MLDDLVGRRDSGVVGIPELLWGLLITYLGDILPAIGLLLEAVSRSPRSIVMLIGIVRIHL